MGDKPILFSAPMVRAILEGRKTQTRRVNKDNLVGWPCPYGVPGDRLWVQETMWQRMAWTWVSIEYKDSCADGRYEYVADGRYEYVANHPEMPDTQEHKFHWRKIPAIHMSRRHSRITLEITKVRVERVQDISEADAKSEGVEPVEWHEDHGGNPGDFTSYRAGFRELWDSINAKRGYGWDKNPWVWVIEFRRVQR